MEKHPSIHLTKTIETLLIVLLFLGLLYALFEVLKAFMGVFTFALIFAVSLAKPFEKLVAVCRGRRKLAAVIYSIILIVIVAQPFLLFISNVNHHIRELIKFVTQVKEHGLPPLPESIVDIPVIGDPLSNLYTQLQQNPKETMAVHEIQIKSILLGLISKGAGIIGAGAEIIIGIIVSAFLLTGGNKILTGLSKALNHIIGNDDGDALIETAGMAIKSVSIGLMGTAFIAACVAWVGLFIAGIPFPLAIAAIVFFLVLIQVGHLPVWIPLIIWLFIQGQNGWATFMIFYGIVLLAIDAIVKPWLISKSGKLPFLVLFLGVVGGMIAWGFTGMFKGAIIVAVFYTVFSKWLQRKEANANEIIA